MIRRAKLDDGRHGRHRVKSLASFSEIDQELLHIEAMTVPEVRKTPTVPEAEVLAVRHQHSRLQRICEIGCDDFGKNLVAEHGIAQSKDYLHALVDVSLHPVGAAQIQFGLAGVAKAEDATVLKKTSNDAAHTDPAAEPANPGPQGAGAAHDQLDPHASL